MLGKTTIAAHVDHVHFGLSILNRWAAGEANPWAGADWTGSWQRATFTEDQWRTLIKTVGVPRSRISAWLDQRDR